MIRSTIDCPPLVSQHWFVPHPHTPIGLQHQMMLQVIKDERFDTLCKRLPCSEVALIRKTVQTKKSDRDLQSAIIVDRLMNPICNRCHDKSNIFRLKLCGACEMTFYCSIECQQADWNASHRQWCCRRDANPDSGPMSTHIIASQLRK